jgi:hypothetical protein
MLGTFELHIGQFSGHINGNRMANSLSSGEQLIAQNGFGGTTPWGRHQCGQVRCGWMLAHWQRSGSTLRELPSAGAGAADRETAGVWIDLPQVIWWR